MTGGTALSRKNRPRKQQTAPPRRPGEPRTTPAQQVPAHVLRALTTAIAHHQAGRLHEAEAIYREIVEARPDQADACHLLGLVAHQTGRQEMAVEWIGRAIEQNPFHADFHVHLGNALQALGRLDAAIASYRQALELDPSHALALNNLGNTLRAQGDAAGALRCYQDAIRARPSYAAAYSNLAVAYREQGRWDAALECLEKALTLEPNLAGTHVNLGSLRRARGELDEAARCYERALALQPRDPETHYNLGNLLQEQGDFDAAARHYEQALRENPRHAKTHYNLALAHAYRSADQAPIARLEQLLEDPAFSRDERAHLHYALAKLCDDASRYDQAFRHYQAANELLRVAFNREDYQASIDAIVSLFSPELIARLSSLGTPSDLPVLIVGMPRSGTTLVEQILASHPSIAGAGEREDLDRIARDLPSRLGAPYPACLRALEQATAHELARTYLDRLRSVSASAARVTDKMPTNYLHLGLLAILLPGARVIHCTRDPLDVCLSCYFQNFTHRLPYTYDLADLGFVYRQYERLMAHWRAVLPATVCEASYEELVRNQQAVSRALVAFCGLEWHDACLMFHRNKRPVQTASSWQVRQPIYTTSLARWKNYEKHLEPLRSALAGAGETVR